MSSFIDINESVNEHYNILDENQEILNENVKNVNENVNHGKIDMLSDMIINQRKDIVETQNYGKMLFKDLKRLEKYLPKNIFHTDECVIYSGYINKQKFICGFYFNKKKVLVNRLLYHNFIGHLDNNIIIENTCENKGICCNIKHLRAKDINHL
jgi:hypothetical protein